MKITILCENQAGHNGSRFILAEWGLSLLIEADAVNILFDAGHTNVYWRNAEQLKVNLTELILSYCHITTGITSAVCNIMVLRPKRNSWLIRN
jgi:metal-dependent hydrolase (beta-lactamase superfamily II)